MNAVDPLCGIANDKITIPQNAEKEERVKPCQSINNVSLTGTI